MTMYSSKINPKCNFKLELDHTFNRGSVKSNDSLFVKCNWTQTGTESRLVDHHVRLALGDACIEALPALAVALHYKINEYFR